MGFLQYVGLFMQTKWFLGPAATRAADALFKKKKEQRQEKGKYWRLNTHTHLVYSTKW